MTVVDIRIPWDSKVYVVPAVTVEVINKHLANGTVFSGEIARAVDAELVASTAKVKNGAYLLGQVRRGLYIYAVFEGGLRAPELTWLARQLDGNAVRVICHDAARRRQRMRMGLAV
ncbi:MAG: hypothetical protein WAV04_01560 [Candidatus Microsaccharimonas sp.]